MGEDEYSPRKRCKRSTSSAIPPWSIDDLPEPLLLEILQRIPSRKTVIRCTSVSKLWFSLITRPDFVPLQPTIVALVDRYNGFIPLCETRSSSRKFDSSDFNFMHSKILDDPEPTRVMGTCNDLVLCFPLKSAYDICKHRQFHICNPYTKERVALPPSPIYSQYETCVGMGFIYEPYYYNLSEESEGRDDRNPLHNMFNVEYRWSVVRIRLGTAHVEIFSSETGEWRVLYDVAALLPLDNDDLNPHYVTSEGIACNGRLYWLTGIRNPERRPFAIEVDPFNVTITLIEVPLGPNESGVLGVHRGCLRLCQTRNVADDINVWELREEAEEDEAGGKLMKKWCSVVSGVSLAQMVSESKDPLITDAPSRYSTIPGRRVFSFHPNNGDVLCLDFVNCTVMCNFQARTLERVPVTASNKMESRIVYPFVLPRWPTPVPKL